MARGTGVFMPRCYSELSRTTQGSNSPAVGSATPELQDVNSQAASVTTAPDQRDDCGGSAAAQFDTPCNQQISSSIKAPSRAYSSQADHQPAQPRAGITVRRVPWQQQQQHPQANSSSVVTNSWTGVAGMQCMPHPPPPPPPPATSVPAPAGGSPRYSSVGKSSNISLSAAGVANNCSPLRPGTHSHFVAAGSTPVSTAKDAGQGQPRLSITDSINSSAFASSLHRASVSSWDGLDSPCNAASATDLAALSTAAPAAAGGVWGLQHQESLDPNLMFDTGGFHSCPVLTLLQGATGAADEAAATPAAAAAAADSLIGGPGGCFDHSGLSHSWADQGRFLASNAFTGGQLAVAHESLGGHSNSRPGSVHSNSSNLVLSSSLPTASYLPAVSTQLCNSSSSNLLFRAQGTDLHPAGTSPDADTIALLRQQLAAARAAANAGAVVSAAPAMVPHRRSSFGSVSASLLGSSMDDFTSAMMLPGGPSVVWSNDLALQQHLQLPDATLGLPNAGGGGGVRTYQCSLSGPCRVNGGLEASPVPLALHVGSVPQTLHNTSHVSGGLQGLPMQMLAPHQQHNSSGTACGSDSGSGGNLMAVAQLKLQQLMAVEQMQQQLQDEVMRLLPLI